MMHALDMVDGGRCTVDNLEMPAEAEYAGFLVSSYVRCTNYVQHKYGRANGRR